MMPVVRCASLSAVIALAVVWADAAAGQDKKDPKEKPFAWRKGEAKKKLMEEHGATGLSEAAVEDGLKWLAKQQKADGTWVYDGEMKAETAAATGMAVLAFLGAGHTPKDGPHAKQVGAGVNALLKLQKADGGFAKAANMYGHAIAGMAVVEAYGMTRAANLKGPAQGFVNFVVRAQGADGSWGYSPGTRGDTSILGWQVQALLAAKACGDLVVPAKPLQQASKFLDTVAGGVKKSQFGYTSPVGATRASALTAVGLFCREHIDGWTAETDALQEGVEGLTGRPPAQGAGDTYYLYYGTRAVHGLGGDRWQTWNGALVKTLVRLQVSDKGPNFGSWPPDTGSIGKSCGRLGTTALCVLTLETPYRYPPPAGPAQ